MKRIRLDRWVSQWQPPRNPRLLARSHDRSISTHARHNVNQRDQAPHQWLSSRMTGVCQRRTVSDLRTEETKFPSPGPLDLGVHESQPDNTSFIPLTPSLEKVRESAKLSALHARLSLPSKLPLEILARCLIDPSADPRPGNNNAPFALLGQDLLGYYTAEYIMCRYPRLPLPIIFAAQFAYVGPQTLASLRAEWGVELVGAPGPEVDPGLLQFKRATPGNSLIEDENIRVKDGAAADIQKQGRRKDFANYRRGMSSRIVHDDQFGDLQPALERVESTLSSFSGQDRGRWEADEGVRVDTASATFVRAVTGALHVFAGTSAAKNFHRAHILSRHLQLHKMFHFSHPTRDLSRLCAREGFEPPVARLISETGRLSRTPVFVVGVYSGDDKLGEGAGASLNEARVRAAAAALRAWYLYSPPYDAIVHPSDVDSTDDSKIKWKPQLIDVGEVVT